MPVLISEDIIYPDIPYYRRASSEGLPEKW